MAACAPHAAPPPAPSGARAAKTDEATALFRFHVDFWANLNEVLLHEALLPRPRWEGPKSLKGHHVASIDALAPAEADAWREALSYYDEHFTTNNLFDRFIDAMPALLAVDASKTPPTTTALDDEWLRRLRVAAPVYRARFWADHDREDRAYVDRMRPLVAAHGAWFAKRIAGVYGMPLPDAPIDVEITPAVPPFGGFTRGEPPYTREHAALITLSSEDPSYAGDTGIEMLFHEVSHLVVGHVQEGLEASAKRQGKKIPPRLWHDVIFYTAGHLARERLGAGYVPYAERPSSRLFAEDDPTLGVLKHAWQPYLDGQVTMAAAIDAVAASY